MRTDHLRSRDVWQQWVVKGIKDWVDKQTGWYVQPCIMNVTRRNVLVSGENFSRGRKEVLENRTKYDEIYAGEMMLLAQMSVIVYCIHWLTYSHVKMRDDVLRNFLYLVVRIRCFDWPLGWRMYLVDTCFKVWKKLIYFCMYRDADKSPARPERKQANVSVTFS